MKPLLIAVTLLALCGCNGAVDEFRNGLPKSTEVALQVPQSANSQQHLQGQVSDFYQLTVGATGLVNGATVAWLDTLKDVVGNPPTSSSGESMTWGPFTPALSANTMKLTVTKTGDNVFNYELDAKGKTQDDSAYVAIISGTHTSTGTDYGQGSFTIDWDAAQTLPQHDNNVGQASFSYARDVNTNVVTVGATFTNVLDSNSGQKMNADYAYTSDPGVFQFKTIDPANGTVWSIRSRWEQSGDGRADAQGTTTSSQSVSASECWDVSFLSQFETISWDPTNPTYNYGDQSVNCGPFTTADYSSL